MYYWKNLRTHTCSCLVTVPYVTLYRYLFMGFISTKRTVKANMTAHGVWSVMVWNHGREPWEAVPADILGTCFARSPGFMLSAQHPCWIPLNSGGFIILLGSWEVCCFSSLLVSVSWPEISISETIGTLRKIKYAVINSFLLQLARVCSATSN